MSRKIRESVCASDAKVALRYLLFALWDWTRLIAPVLTMVGLAAAIASGGYILLCVGLSLQLVLPVILVLLPTEEE